jgi:hypothetical protein
MLPTNTSFVIGAGSGFDIGMPLGFDLIKTIEHNAKFKAEHGRIVGDPEALVQSMFCEQIPGTLNLRRRQDQQSIYGANVRIRDATNLVGSIDDYVNLHNSDENLVRAAKIQIAYAILSSERKCALRPTQVGYNASDLKRLDKTWMFDFFKMISKPSNSQNPEDIFKNISIINFNYDRCLEQFLISAIGKLYNIEVAEAARLVRDADIVHPYGQVGDLPVIRPTEDSVEFGDNTGFQSITRASNLIKTYTEQVNSEVTTRIKNMINNCTRVVFLGFGFHRQNIDLLSIAGQGQPHRTIYGTAIGESDPNILEYAVRLRGIGGTVVPGQRMPGQVSLRRELDCSGLIQSYREVLSS